MGACHCLFSCMNMTEAPKEAQIAVMEIPDSVVEDELIPEPVVEPVKRENPFKGGKIGVRKTVKKRKKATKK